MVQSVWAFFQYQMLGMRWLNDLVGRGLSLLGVDVSTRVGGSIHFFLYDTVKILILLAALIFAVSYVQSYFPPERTKKILGRYRGVGAHVMGALLGTVTPFCSCSSIPLFIGFTRGGLPLGVTFSFLISSPLVDLASFVLLMSVFGPGVALAYVIVGLVLAVIGGTFIEKLHMEQHLEPFARSGGTVDVASPEWTRRDRVRYARRQVSETVRRVGAYVLIGVGIGALIHNWIPQPIIETVLGENNPFSVLLATVVGVPVYADIFGTLPIAEALFARGVLIGTVLAFMMAVTTLSLPSLIMLSKVVKPKLLGTFVAVVMLGIVVIGYLFNGYAFVLA